MSHVLELAGKDRAFRMFSVIQDQQSRELSQGKTASKARRLKIEEAELKLPPVIDVAACQVPAWPSTYIFCPAFYFRSYRP